jgi:hypothetical protein
MSVMADDDEKTKRKAGRPKRGQEKPISEGGCSSRAYARARLDEDEPNTEPDGGD